MLKLRTLLAFGLFSLTTACIDAEVEMNFIDATTVEGALDFSMSRQLFDLTGGDTQKSCPEGEQTLTEEIFTCRTTGAGPLEELLEKQALPFNGGETSPAEGARFERTGDNTLRVTIDFADLLKGRDTPKDMEGMEGMIRAALAGHSFVFKVKAYKILNTTGTLTEDQTEASFVIPVVKLLDAEPDIGGPFVTELQLEQSCTLWVFCD